MNFTEGGNTCDKNNKNNISILSENSFRMTRGRGQMMPAQIWLNLVNLRVFRQMFQAKNLWFEKNLVFQQLSPSLRESSPEAIWGKSGDVLKQEGLYTKI